MNIKEYRSLLGQLPIKCPTRQQMALLCPHITEDDAFYAFVISPGFIAVPPLRVRNGFQVLSYTKEWIEKTEKGMKNHPATIDWAFTARTKASYVENKSHEASPARYLYMERAMIYANNNWGNELVLDNWTSVVSYDIQDPTDLVNDRYHCDFPRTKAVLYVALSRDINEIVNDNSRPESELFDDAIVQMTLDPFVWQEIKGGRGGFTRFNCANCGAGLGLSSCNGCGFRFRDEGIRCGGDTPLSRKMVSFLLENEHVFKVDPEVAWKKELQKWQNYKK